MKKVVSLTLCALFFIAAFAGCGQKGLTTEVASGWYEFNLTPEQCKEQMNRLIQEESSKIGDLKKKEYDDAPSGSVVEKIVDYRYDYADSIGNFAIMNDGGRDKILIVSNSLYTDEATPGAEDAWKQINRATLRTLLPKLSEKKCEEILSELGETDPASRTEGYDKNTTLDGTKISLVFQAADPNKSYTQNYISLDVTPVQPAQK